jgi:hypothetical protein
VVAVAVRLLLHHCDTFIADEPGDPDAGKEVKELESEAVPLDRPEPVQKTDVIGVCAFTTAVDRIRTAILNRSFLINKL